MKKVFLLTYLVSIFSAHGQQNFSFLDSLFAKNNFDDGRGYSVALIKNDALIYERNSNGFDLNKEIPIASASKWLAGAVIMRLCEKGLLSLDDKISKYIPSFNSNDKKNITLRQCFSHTSGLPGGQEAFDEFMGKRLKSYERITDDIAEVNLIAEPGKQFNYGGMSMQVAGRVAEIVSGKNFHQLFKEELTDPLEMLHTHYGGYRLKIAPRIAGGVSSTGNDYLHFLSMIMHKGIYNGKRFLSESSLQTLLSDQTGSASVGYSPFSKYANSSTVASYGIGNWLLNFGYTKLNSSPGAFGFTPWIDMQKGYYGVIAVRSDFRKVMPVFVQAIPIINEKL